MPREGWHSAQRPRPTRRKHVWCLGELSLLLFLRNRSTQFSLNFIEVSSLQQSDSVRHMYTFFFVFVSKMVYHRILDRVPCAAQPDLVVHPSYRQQFASAHPKLPVFPAPKPHPWQPQVCSLMSVSLFLFCRWFICAIF